MKTIWNKCTPALVILFTLLTFACTKYEIPGKQAPEINTGPDPVGVSTCDPDTIYFQNTILPLVVSSCATTGCHDQSSHREGIILTDYTSILRTGKIRPGDPNDSKFLRSLTEGGEDKMPPPPNNPLNSDQVSMIRQWIAQGALNNACFDGCDTTVATFSGQIWPIMQSHCTGCHSSGSAGGGIVIADYTDLIALAENGSLMGSIGYEPGYANMPPNQQLSECSISLLQKWIDDGYPD
jgi:hypothetical protein